MDVRLRAILAVLDLTFCIYSFQKAFAEAFRRSADALVLNDIDADAGDHKFMLQVKRRDQMTFLHVRADRNPQRARVLLL